LNKQKKGINLRNLNKSSNHPKENIKKVKTNCLRISYVHMMVVTANTAHVLHSTTTSGKGTQEKTSDCTVSYE